MPIDDPTSLLARKRSRAAGSLSEKAKTPSAGATPGKAGYANPRDAPGAEPLAAPDMSVLRLGHRAPPALPLDVFGAQWGKWITNAAQAAAAPPDYVALPLLAAASGLIGHAPLGAGNRRMAGAAAYLGVRCR